MITPAKPARITAYSGDDPLWRITLQISDREGKTLTYQPEVAATHGSAPDYAIAHLFRGFRERLEITWAVGLGSGFEVYAGSAWSQVDDILTAQALMEILSGCDDGAMWVEPYGADCDGFWGRCYAEPVEIRDIKGVAHTGLKLLLEASGGRGPSDSAAINATGGLTTEIPKFMADPNAPVAIMVSGVAAAVSRSEVYVVRDTQIVRWDPTTGAESVWGSAPPEGSVQSLEVVGSTLRAHCAVYSDLIDATTHTGYPALILKSYRAQIAQVGDWTQYGQHGSLEVNLLASPDQGMRSTVVVAATFASGQTAMLGDWRYFNVLSDDGRVNWYMRFAGDADPDLGFLPYQHASAGFYWVDFGRTLLGATRGDRWAPPANWATPIPTTIAADRTCVDHPGVGRLTQIGSTLWLVSPTQIRRADGTGNPISLAGYSLTSQPRIAPFGDRTLILLDAPDAKGRTALWFDGATVRPDFIGSPRGTLRPIARLGATLATCRTVQALADGSVLLSA